MVDAGLVASERTVLIRGSGVDVSVFQPSPPPPGPPIVIMPARLVWYKGRGRLRRSRAPAAAGGVAIRMALVGEPPAHNRASVPRSQLEAWVAQGVIEWWGYQPDMPRVYAGCHIVCLPSFYGEGIPRALLEAAACARPIVTTDIPGAARSSSDGDNGLLVPPRAPRRWPTALRTLAEDPGLRLAMGRRGRERAVAEFSLDRVVAATLAVYQRLSATAVS